MSATCQRRALTPGDRGRAVFFPILGNLRPDLVSFLPSMRQYAGNWASAPWAFKPGGGGQAQQPHAAPHPNQVDQLTRPWATRPRSPRSPCSRPSAGGRCTARAVACSRCCMHHVPDLDKATVREAEFACNSIVGLQLRRRPLPRRATCITAMQKRCDFEPGEFIVVWVESQPIHKPTQAYKVIDAGLSASIERGTWNVAEAVNEQPWLPNGPIPTERHLDPRTTGPATAGSRCSGQGRRRTGRQAARARRVTYCRRGRRRARTGSSPPRCWPGPGSR